jgi:hypothetical protein
MEGLMFQDEIRLAENRHETGDVIPRYIGDEGQLDTTIIPSRTL